MIDGKRLDAGLKFATKNLARHLTGASAILIALYVIDQIFTKEIPPGNRDVAILILGLVMGWAGSVYKFHFGSSSGSKEKTEQLGGLHEEIFQLPPPAPRPGSTLGPDPGARPDLSGRDYVTYPERGSAAVDEPD